MFNKTLVFCACIAFSAEVFAGTVANVYDDNIGKDGRYVYAYPENSSSIREVTDERYSGKGALKIVLDTKVYSGAAIGNYPPAELKAFKETGRLEFWVKGAKGGELFQIILVDSGDADGTKAEVRVPVAKFAKITTNWQKVSIPLSSFGDEGVWWDGSKEQKTPFVWNDVVEVKFAILPLPGEKNFTIYVDGIQIVD